MTIRSNQKRESRSLWITAQEEGHRALAFISWSAWTKPSGK